jgi:phosphatidate cytidylyltransferase
VKARIIVGVLGAPLLFGIVWAGSPYLPILVGLVSLWALWEFYRLARDAGASVPLPLGLILTILFVVNGQLTADEGNFAVELLIVTIALSLAWALWLHLRQTHGFPRNFILTALGPIYVGLLLSHGLMLREAGNAIYDGRDWLLLAIFVTFATDTAAYFTGRAIGRHKMAPSISPKKTWEGAIGGMLGALGASFGLAAILDLGISLGWQAIVGIILGLGAQLGDLAESWFKRRAKAKDASHILPGHGGLLDRLDSLLVTIPMTYYLPALIIY